MAAKRGKEACTMPNRVFYRVGENHWQDSGQRFTNGHEMMQYAATWDHARITDEEGNVGIIVGRLDPPGFYGPWKLPVER